MERDRTSARKRDGTTRRASRQRRRARGNVGQEGTHGRQAIHQHSRRVVRRTADQRRKESRFAALEKMEETGREGGRERESALASERKSDMNKRGIGGTERTNVWSAREG